MKKILLFLSFIFLFFSINAQISFRATVGIDSIVTVDTVNYTASLNSFNDQMGLSLTALNVAVDHYFIDAAGKRYKITSVANATFTEVSVGLQEVYGTDGAPNALGGMVYEEGNNGVIPFVPDNSTGITQVLKAHIETINANIIHDFGDSVSVAGKQTNLNQLPFDTATLGDYLVFVDTSDNNRRKLESLTDVQSLIGGGGGVTASNGLEKVGNDIQLDLVALTTDNVLNLVTDEFPFYSAGDTDERKINGQNLKDQLAQDADEVNIDPIVGISATEVQGALAEHQADIDALAGGAADGVIDSVSVDINNENVDFLVNAPGSNIMDVDFSGFATDQALSDSMAVAGDNLGNHTATQSIQLNGQWINGDNTPAEGLTVDNDGNVTIANKTGSASELNITESSVHGADVVTITTSGNVTPYTFLVPPTAGTTGRVLDPNGGWSYPDAIEDADGDTGIFSELSPDEDRLRFYTDGNLRFLLDSIGSAGIGLASIDASAKLQIDATDKGMLIPRMTNVQRDAITSPATGLMIYSTTSNSFFYYNGSAWTEIGSGGGGSIDVDTFANMAAARLATINAKLVYLSDDKIKGFFEPVPSGVDNGITRFVDNGSQVWERIVNNGDIELAWDEDAENDADKIIDAITLADVGGTVWLEDASYEIEKALTLTNGKKIKVRGNNTVLYRDTTLSFVISEATSTSQNWIKGASVDFETQMEVSVITGNTDSDVQAFTGGSFRAIVLSISGDTIFLDKNLGGDWNGYEVITSHPLIRAQGQPITVEGITFDERRNINNKNYSWRILGVIHSNQETVIRGNTFNNIISTVAFLPYGSIKGNVCDSLITLAHITKNPNPTLGTNKLVTVRDNFISYAGLNAAECNHCEGALVTFSNGTENLTVENNTLFWIKNAVLGNVSDDDKRIRVIGNTAINPDSSYTDGSAFRVTNNAGSHVNTYDDAGLEFANNYFWQVGNIEILGGNDAIGNATYLVGFRNNEIINGKVRFQKIQTLHMNDNTIGFTGAFDYPNHTLSLTDDLDRFALILQGVNHSEFYNNKIIASVKSDSLWGGIALSNSYYNKFYNTNVKGYEVGVSTRQTTSGTKHDFELLFSGGVIEVRDTSSISEGAACFKIGRGVTVMNFELVAHGGNPFITNLATSGESTKMGVRLVNNYIHSNLYALYAVAGKTGDAILKDNYGYAFAAGDSGLGSGDWSDGTERTIRDGNTFMIYSDSDAIPYPLPLPRIDLISYE